MIITCSSAILTKVAECFVDLGAYKQPFVLEDFMRDNGISEIPDLKSTDELQNDINQSIKLVVGMRAHYVIPVSITLAIGFADMGVIEHDADRTLDVLPRIIRKQVRMNVVLSRTREGSVLSEGIPQGWPSLKNVINLLG